MDAATTTMETDVASLSSFSFFAAAVAMATDLVFQTAVAVTTDAALLPGSYLSFAAAAMVTASSS